MSIPSNAHLIWHPFVGFCMHEAALPVPPFAVPYYPHIDFDVVNGLYIFSQPTQIPGQKISSGEILDLGVSMEGQMADAGFIVPHVPIPPVPYNALLPLIIFFGSSKILMGSGQTIILTRSAIFQQEAPLPAGCCLFPHVPLSLNLQCWDPVPLPTDIVIAPNTVQVGINGADYLDALEKWAIEIATAVLMKCVGKLGKKAKAWWKGTPKVGLEAAEEGIEMAVMKGSQEAAEEAAEKAAREAVEEAAEKGAGKAAGKISGEAAEEGIEMAVIKGSQEAAEDAAEKAAREGIEEAAEKGAKEAGESWRSMAGRTWQGVKDNKISSVLKLGWKLGLKPFVADPWLRSHPGAIRKWCMDAGLFIIGSNEQGPGPQPGPPDAAAAPPPDYDLDFDSMPPRLQTAYVLGLAATFFGADIVRRMYEDLEPLVSDCCGHGQDYADPRDNYWGGEWQVFRAE